MTQSEAERILAELAEVYGEVPFDPEKDVSVRVVAQQLGLTKDTARRILERQVQAGVLSSRLLRVNGQRTKVYRRVSDG